MTRRTLLRGALAVGATAGAPYLNIGRCRLFGQPSLSYSARTLALLERTPVWDMLGLLTLDWDRQDRWFHTPGGFTSQDWQTISGSGIAVFHPAVSLTDDDAPAATERWMQGWIDFAHRQADRFTLIRSVAEADALRATRRIGIVLGMQNSTHFAAVTDVERFYRLGQRVSQLTYNLVNALGAGALASASQGLTEFGGQIVGEMNRAGMAVDLSHVGDRSTLDACAATRQPVVITHSNCRSIAHHPRCKSDEVIKRVAQTGGVMGITSIRAFVGGGNVTVENVVDHFDYAARLTGVEHVGVGSDTDLDGRQRFVRGLENPAAGRSGIPGLDHPRRIFDLTEGLVRRGYSDRDIELMLGGNWRRVLGAIWRG